MYELVILETICTTIFVIIKSRLLDLQLRLGRDASDNSLSLHAVVVMTKTLIDMMVSHWKVFLQTLIETLSLYRVRKLVIPCRIVIVDQASSMVHHKLIQLRHIQL